MKGAVLLSGWPLYAITRILRHAARDYLCDLPPHLREPLEDKLGEMQRASEQLLEASRGTKACRGAEPCLPSSMSTTDAAQLLGCTSRWIRRLIADDRLPATREGRAWSIDRKALNDYMDRKTKGTSW